MFKVASCFGMQSSRTLSSWLNPQCTLHGSWGTTWPDLVSYSVKWMQHSCVWSPKMPLHRKLHCKVLSLKCYTNQSTPFLSPVSLRIQFSWKKTALQWRTGKPGVLKSMGSQRADTTERHNRQLWSKGLKVAQAGGQKCRNWDISYKPQENTST